jgi:hypothetical protein
LRRNTETATSRGSKRGRGWVAQRLRRRRPRPSDRRHSSNEAAEQPAWARDIGTAPGTPSRTKS